MFCPFRLCSLITRQLMRARWFITSLHVVIQDAFIKPPSIAHFKQTGTQKLCQAELCVLGLRMWLWMFYCCVSMEAGRRLGRASFRYTAQAMRATANEQECEQGEVTWEEREEMKQEEEEDGGWSCSRKDEVSMWIPPIDQLIPWFGLPWTTITCCLRSYWPQNAGLTPFQTI